MDGVTSETIGLVPVSMVIDQARINRYAAVIDDFNPIHVDPEFARQSAMGGIIAHGTLSLNLIWQSVRATFPEAGLAGARLDVRFQKPVRLGDTITGGGRSADGGGFEVWVKNQNGETVISGQLSLPGA